MNFNGQCKVFTTLILKKKVPLQVNWTGYYFTHGCQRAIEGWYCLMVILKEAECLCHDRV